MKLTVLFTLSLIFLTVGCGGGGGGDDSDGMVLEGTLIQGSGSGHALISPKHSEGEPIGEVEICALGGCSTIDATGHWGFLVEGEFGGGDVAFTVQGHGIDTTAVVDIPAGTRSAAFDFINNGGAVSAHTIVFDGVEHEHSHDESESEHAE